MFSVNEATAKKAVKKTPRDLTKLAMAFSIPVNQVVDLITAAPKCMLLLMGSFSQLNLIFLGSLKIT